MLTRVELGGSRVGWFFRLMAVAAVLPGAVGACTDSSGDCTTTKTCVQPPEAGARADAAAGASSGGSSANGGSSFGGAIAGGDASFMGGAGGASTAGAAGTVGHDAGSPGDAAVTTDAGSHCEKGFADCNHSPDDGCEANLAKDIDHCGGCDVACSASGTTDRACNDGVCNVVCDITHADCDKDGSDGCEVDLKRDTANCGACNAACSAAGTTQTACIAGVCSPSCDATHADCDKDGKNGCEVDLQADPDHCGGCGAACSGAGTTTRACVAGVCTPTCDAAHADCDEDGKTGCEVDVVTDPDHCGTCATSCSPQNVKARLCVAGACTPVCNSGFDDCSTNTNDGCETNLDTDASCGACGHSCLGGACSSEQCQAFPLGSSLPTPHGIAVDANYVHWVDGTQSGGRLMRVALAGGASTPVVASLPGPYDAASDGQYVYWSNLGDGTDDNGSIQRVSSGSSNVQSVVTPATNSPFNSPHRIAVDSTHVFWSDTGGVFEASKTGSGLIAVPGLVNPAFSIAVDSTYVYGAFLGILRGPISGSGTPLSFNVGDVISVAVDGTYVYYPHQEKGVQGIYKVASDFSGNQTLVSAVSVLSSSPLAMDATYIYYSDGTNLSRVPKAGGNSQPLSNKVSSVFAIVVTKDAVYWSNTGVDTADGSVMKLAL